MRIILMTMLAFTALAPLPSAAQLANPAPETSPKGGRMRDVLMSLSPQGQMVFRKEWLGTEREEAPSRKSAASAAEDNVLAAMAAEPFNPDALRRAYADQRNVTMNNQRERQEHLVEVLKKLSPADRRIMVNQLRALRKRG